MTSFSIRESSKKLGVSEMYLRKCILEDKIHTTHVAISDKVWRHEISEDELAKFKVRSSNRSSRDDGRNKFTIYLSKSEEVKIRELLKTNNLDKVGALLQRANPSNSTK